MFTFSRTTARGFHAVSRTAVEAVPLPKRTGVPRWQGIEHKTLVKTTFALAEKAGIKILKDEWALSSDKNDLYGNFTVELPKAIKFPDLVVPSMGLIHSNMGHTALRVVAGGIVKVCTNGLVTTSGEIVVNRKHTTGVVLEETMAEGLKKFLERIAEVPKFVIELQKIEVSNDVAAKFILNAGLQGWMPWIDVGDAAKQWTTPNHPEFKPRTAWSLYNSFTETAKQRPVPGQQKLFRLLAPALLRLGTKEAHKVA